MTQLKMGKHLSALLILFLAAIGPPELSAQCLPSDVYANDSVPEICEEVTGVVRSFYANNLPSHPFGPWPTPFEPAAKDFDWHMCAYPVKGDTSISLYGYDMGSPGCSDIYKVGISYTSCYLVAWAAMYFVDTAGQNNLNWNVEATTLNLDDYGAHVQTDEYHYHIPPAKYYEDSLGIDGTFHSPLLGYAADGFPMYFKYGYSDPMNPNSPVVELRSCFQLKSGNRPGDGLTAPNGPYDGTYTEDYEHIPSSNCELDECNGRFGITPEFPNGTYYYVMTEDFPYMPRCFFGTVLDRSFRQGPNCGSSTAATDCSPLTTSSDYLSEQLGLSIYPNPSAGQVQIGTTNPDLFQSSIQAMRVLDQRGTEVWASEEAVSSLDLQSFANGTYFLEVSTATQQLTQKIILNR